ncbi:hypothetical protein GCM10009414_07660 [Tatumella terrea]|uniref:Uncharacterized protein n=1 Tax=Tatumella terrea TaxID=419007 RepID=A0ABW1W1R9_9GAMM|nr:hypothetical protein [Tatumella sp. JGM118]MBS0908114.1 hypothetical protein [Tatumella sp. JGM118]
MIAGFVALMISHSRVLPVTKALYPTETQCQSALKHDQKQRPGAELLCGEVMRSRLL